MGIARRHEHFGFIAGARDVRVCVQMTFSTSM